MTRDEFRRHVETELQTMSAKNVRRFARLCAIRALPFLGAIRDFVYWPEESRQIHLQNIFYAIDIIGDSIVFDAFYTNDAAYDAYDAADAANVYDTFADADASYAAADAAYAAANAAYAAANAYAAADAANAALRVNKNFRDIILDDLLAIKNYELHTVKHDVNIYGEIWTNFQKSLISIGCEYWAKLYQNIFDNQFQIDEDSLKQRLNVPSSIRAEGAAAVAYYLEGIAEYGKKGMNEVRIILLGDKGAGKTSLARKLLDPEADLPNVEDSTQGVDVSEWEIHGDLRAHIWDFAGHVVTHTAHRFFLAESCVYVIVYNGREEKVQNRSEIEYWVSQIQNYGGNSPVYILINEFDSNPIDIGERGLQRKYPFIKKVIRMSLKKDIKAIRNFRTQLEQLIGDDTPLNKAIPASWFAVKERLTELFKIQNKEHITLEDFQKIANESGISKDIEKMREALHALGICLHYDDIDEINTFVLSPTWITYGIYKIIDWLSRNGKQGTQARGLLRKKDLKTIFMQKEDKKRYPESKHDFLIKLMLKYELAYPVKDKPDAYILPLALPKDTLRPGIEKSFTLKKGGLLLRYTVEGALPPDTITRFIVRHHKSIASEGNKQIVWRYGVFLLGNSEPGNTNDKALIVEDGLTIWVAVKGDNAKKFLKSIRTSLNNIFSEYKSNDPTLEYAVDDDIYLTENVIWSIGDNPYYDGRTGREFFMKEVIDGYGLEEHPLKRLDADNPQKPEVEKPPWPLISKVGLIFGIVGAIATVISVVR